MMLTSNTAQHNTSMLLHQRLLQRRLAQLATANTGSLPLASASTLSAAIAAVAAAAPLAAMGICTSAAVDSTGRFQSGLSSTSTLSRSDASSLLQRILNAGNERRLAQQRRLSQVQQQAQQLQQQLQQQSQLQRTTGRLVPVKAFEAVSLVGDHPWLRHELAAANSTAQPVKALTTSVVPRVLETGILSGLAEKLKQQQEQRQQEHDEMTDSVATSSTDGDTREVGPAEMKLLKKMEPLPHGMSRKDARWDEMYQELIAYKMRTGTCIVPRGFAENPRLASWVAEQR
jgi:Helicase associated domain